MRFYRHLHLFLSLFSGFVFAGDLQLLFPESLEALSYNQGGFLKAIFTSSEQTEFQLMQEQHYSISLPIASIEAKEDFPRAIMEMFTENFNVNILLLEFLHVNGDTSSFEYNFSTNRPLDLKDFWKTTDFRRALQKVNDIDGIRLDVSMFGWNVEKRILNSSNRSNHPDLIGSSLAFKPGENEFFLHFRNENYELVHADTLRYYYFVSSIAEDTPEDMEKNQFHGENEDKCSYCHTELEDDDCSFCHSSILDMEFMHSPTEEMECNTCHDDESDTKFELLEDFREDPASCTSCHSDQEDEVGEMENVHPPMEETCLICHDPHGTPNNYLLVLRTNELCLSCHDNVQEGIHPVKKHPHSGFPNPLRPTDELSCTSCHHPHASDEEYLMRGNWSELCQSCHFKN